MLYIFPKSTRSAGGSRHRAFFWFDFLCAAGYGVEIIAAPIYRLDVPRTKARLEYFKKILSLRKGDVVLLQNPIFNRYFIVLICLIKIIFRPTIVFDFDDATWVQNPIAPRIIAFFADKFIVASHYLATWKNIRGRPVLVMPNLINYEVSSRYSAPRIRETEKIVLGWIGNAPDSMDNLSLLVPVMRELASRGTPCTLRIVGTLGDDAIAKTFTATGIPFEEVTKLDWGKEGEIQKANAAFDIGLCPLVDTELNRARCSLKIPDYMAAGIPVVASPIGENVYFVEDGATGFLPKNTQEWIERLELLIRNADLRVRIGTQARGKVVREFSYQTNIARFASFLGLHPSV